MKHESTVAPRYNAWAVWEGSAGVAVITMFSYRLHLNYATVGFLYLLLVVLLSITGNFLCSAITSILAVGCLDYFFVPPIMSLRVIDSHDALALTAFLLTALVITKQASTARRQTISARRHRTELELLFRAAGRLLAADLPRASPWQLSARRYGRGCRYGTAPPHPSVSPQRPRLPPDRSRPYRSRPPGPAGSGELDS